jgi:hypothetical protein
MDINIHRVTGIEMSELREVSRGDGFYYVRDIVITSEDGEVTITVFSTDDNKEACQVRA